MKVKQFHFAANLTILTAASMVLFGCTSEHQLTTTQTTSKETTSKDGTKTAATSTDAKESSESDSSANAQKLDIETDDKELSKKVLMRPDFIGRVKMCYMAGQKIPKLLQKLFCYCGCDYTDEHVSLLDCYTSDHSVDCSYCQGEAMMAFKMRRKGSSDAEIQKAIDLNWGPHYPFNEQPSEAIKKYWKERLWAPGAGPTAAEKHDEAKPLFDPFTGAQASDSKPMGKPGEGCCGGKGK